MQFLVLFAVLLLASYAQGSPTTEQEESGEEDIRKSDGEIGEGNIKESVDESDSTIYGDSDGIGSKEIDKKLNPQQNCGCKRKGKHGNNRKEVSEEGSEGNSREEGGVKMHDRPEYGTRVTGPVRDYRTDLETGRGRSVGKSGKQQTSQHNGCSICDEKGSGHGGNRGGHSGNRGGHAGKNDKQGGKGQQPNQDNGAPNSGPGKSNMNQWYYYDDETENCDSCIRCECPENNQLYPCKKDCFEDNICGKHQHYSDCGTACPLTCENCKNPRKLCNKMCVEGCFCDKGYVLIRNGTNKTCVTKEDCPKCGKNEAYRDCKNCESTCENPCPRKCKMLRCVPGCQCKKGFVRNNEGNCVLPCKCPQKTCTVKPERGPGKDNITNWYYDSKTGKCNEFIYGGFGGNGNRFLTKEVCMKTCGKVCTGNQTYLDCGTACPLTCDNCKSPRSVCSDMCVKGCFCNKGYVRNQTGSCVRTKDCPKCGENAEYKICGTAVPLTCENYHNPPKNCTEQCVRGCFCKKGFVKNCKGQCVKTSECPSKDQGEDYFDCLFDCFSFSTRDGPYEPTCRCNRKRTPDVTQCFKMCGALREKPQASYDSGYDHSGYSEEDYDMFLG